MKAVQVTDLSGDRVSAFTMGAFAEVAATPPHLTFRLPEQQVAS